MKNVEKFIINVFATSCLALTALPAKSFDNITKTDIKSEAESDKSDTNKSIWLKSADELDGMEVYNSANNNNVGEVEKIVSDNQRQKLYAVVAVDQMLDLIGGKKVIVGINDLNLNKDKLEIAVSESQLKKWPEYNESNYYTLKLRDRPIKEVSDLMNKI